jgi:hypothetical protein
MSYSDAMARAPSKFRQRDATRALRAAKAAGIEVGRFEISADGRIIIIPAGDTALAATDDELDRELEEFESRHGQS